MSVYATVLAAGSGVRFGADKVSLVVRGRPVWKHAFDSLVTHPEVSGVGIVCQSGHEAAIRDLAPNAAFVVAGGADRFESSRIGFQNLPSVATIALVHDGARPWVDADTVSRVVSAVREFGASAPAIECVDTARYSDENSAQILLDRRRILLMQTPQGARVEILRDAYQAPGASTATDEMAMIESLGIQPKIVQGSPDSFKITQPSDLARYAGLLGVPESRTGFGYDIHPFSTDESRPLWLGGVLFSEAIGLEGHSDADVLLHAIVDALLGAAGLGDIGVHFPNDDPQWRGAPSIGFLQYAGTLLAQKGWRIRNIDATVVAEAPKIMARAEEMRRVIGEAVGLEIDRIGLKATTNERLGAIGRQEGIAAFAVATIAQHP